MTARSAFPIFAVPRVVRLAPLPPLPLAARRRRVAPTLALLGALSALASPAMAAGDVEAGKAMFAARCASCHAVGPMATSGFGPQLNRLFNRRAGSVPDYDYSTAMKQSGIVWDDKTLATFIANPGKTVPGTKMRFWGIGNERKVADLLAYLHTFK
ncbi:MULTISPECIES: c-type cytochrome [Pandoraea]|uniref:Cytochrome c2 n=1 Tax=Pandoraea cepalis TaxID=2508294 RepID=A0A5E4SUB4_9BURK|nr:MULTISPECIES: c-type cytochrome [Pandoraea]VVD78721.1 Cytochrome c2 [Pandoraea cepalis]